MDEMPSARFRREYAKLLRPTIVTANGHPIGVWQPYAGPQEPRWRDALGVEPVPAEVSVAMERYNTRPFTPVPKAGSRPRV